MNNPKPVPRVVRRGPRVVEKPKKGWMLPVILMVLALGGVGAWYWATLPAGGEPAPSTTAAAEPAETPEAAQPAPADPPVKAAPVRPSGDAVKPPAVAVGGPALFFAGGPGTTRFTSAQALSNGDLLIAGATDDLAWTGSAPKQEWPVPADNPGGSGSMYAFVLQTSADLSSIKRVYHFPKGTMDEVTRIRSTEVPGNPTGEVFLSGRYANLEGENDGYWIARMDGNFVQAQPEKPLWLRFIPAAARQAAGYKGNGDYAESQPWDVRNDGGVVCAVGASYDFRWAAFKFLGPDGEPAVMTGWPQEGGDSIIALKAGRENSLRSATQEDFDFRTEDENGNPGRKGWYPDDVYFKDPKDRWGPGYTGYRLGKAPTQRVGKIDIDRRNNHLYFGTSTQSRLPDGNPDFEPAIVAMDDQGRLLWWARGYKEVERVGDSADAHQDHLNSPPDQYIDAVAVDYVDNRLVVVARSHGNGVINFWSGKEIARNSGRPGFQVTQTGSNGNIHVSWLGEYGLKDGKIYAASWMAELADGARTGPPQTDGPLAGWPSPNDGWPDVNTTRLSDLTIDAAGRPCVIAVGRRPYTTAGALIENVKPGEGASAWAPFARVYDADLGGLAYSSILRGPWDKVTGRSTDDSTVLTSIVPLRDGVIVLGRHVRGDSGQVTPPAAVNAPSWGTSVPAGAQSGFVAVLPVANP